MSGASALRRSRLPATQMAVKGTLFRRCRTGLVKHKVPMTYMYICARPVLVRYYRSDVTLVTMHIIEAWRA